MTGETEQRRVSGGGRATAREAPGSVVHVIHSSVSFDTRVKAGCRRRAEPGRGRGGQHRGCEPLGQSSNQPKHCTAVDVPLGVKELPQERADCEHKQQDKRHGSLSCLNLRLRSAGSNDVGDGRE